MTQSVSSRPEIDIRATALELLTPTRADWLLKRSREEPTERKRRKLDGSHLVKRSAWYVYLWTTSNEVSCVTSRPEIDIRAALEFPCEVRTSFLHDQSVQKVFGSNVSCDIDG